MTRQVVYHPKGPGPAYAGLIAVRRPACGWRASCPAAVVIILGMVGNIMNVHAVELKGSKSRAHRDPITGFDKDSVRSCRILQIFHVVCNEFHQ